jgi:hypothetical protein
VFRLNIRVPRAVFAERFPDWSDEAEVDFAASDVVLPHPVYWRQSWIAVVSPSAHRLAEVEPWLVAAHDGAMRAI